MQVVIVGDLMGPSDTSGIMGILASQRVDVVVVNATASTETIAPSYYPLLIEDLTSFPVYTEPEKPKPDKGHFRRQFGGTGERLDRRYK